MALFRCNGSSNPFTEFKIIDYDSNPHTNDFGIPISSLKGFTKATITVIAGTSSAIYYRDGVGGALTTDPTVAPGGTIDFSNFTTGLSIRTYGTAAYNVRFS